MLHSSHSRFFIYLVNIANFCVSVLMLTAARHEAVGLPAAAHPDATAPAAAYPQPPEARPGPTAAHCHHAVSAAR